MNNRKELEEQLEMLQGMDFSDNWVMEIHRNKRIEEIKKELEHEDC